MIYDVYSFDFDGCLANIAFLSSKQRDILTANRDLLNLIQLSDHNKVVFVGSNRQSIPDDYTNSGADERGSCFPAIQTISQELKAALDDFLLSDIYHDLPDGTSFKQALKYLTQNNKDYTAGKTLELKSCPNWIHDESKLTLLYAQIHKIASEHPNDEIRFNFFDDREDLLNNLHACFSKYPDLIPRNVTLNLKKYRGPIDRSDKPIEPQIVDYPSIQGTRSQYDANYRQTVKLIAAVTIEKMTQQGIDISTSKASKPITTFAEAKQHGFDMSAIKCVRYYEPGMMPRQTVDTPTVTGPSSAAKPQKTRGLFSPERQENNSNSASSSRASSSSSSPGPSVPGMKSLESKPFPRGTTTPQFFKKAFPQEIRALDYPLISKHRMIYRQTNKRVPADITDSSIKTPGKGGSQ